MRAELIDWYKTLGLLLLLLLFCFWSALKSGVVVLQITVIEALIEKCDVILLGGGMIFTFLKAKGLGVGKSLVRARVEFQYQHDLAKDHKRWLSSSVVGATLSHAFDGRSNCFSRACLAIACDTDAMLQIVDYKGGG